MSRYPRLHGGSGGPPSFPTDDDDPPWGPTKDRRPKWWKAGKAMSSLDSEAALRELPDYSLTQKDVNNLLDLLTAAEADVERLAHKAAQIGFTYGALGRDFEYAYKNVNDMLADRRSPDTEAL